MVMHARKYQRLNDGYYEKEQAHPYEEKNPSKHRHYNDRYTDNERQSPNFHCVGGMSDARSQTVVDESPPARAAERYQNKASYIERTKEKPDKVSAADKSVDKHQYHDRVHKGGKEGRNREQKERDHRAEVRKSAIRVCGDWSEHISSSGKCYYYNCKTEVSRWEKPKEWLDKIADGGKSVPPAKSKDARERRHQSGHPVKKYDDRQKHSVSATVTSSSADFHPQSNSRISSSFASPALRRHVAHEHSGNGTPSHKNRQSQGHCTTAAASATTGPNSMPNSNSSQNNRSSHRVGGLLHANARPTMHDHVKRDGTHMSAADRMYSASERSNKMYENRANCDGSALPAAHHHQHQSSSRTIVQTADVNGAKHERNDYEDSQQAEDMDISPGSTPTEESMMEKQALITTNIGSTPVSVVTAMTTPAPSVSKHSPSAPNVLSVLSHLTSLSSSPDLPALASLSSLTAMSPGGTSGSPGSLLPQLLQQLAAGSRLAPPNAHGPPQHNQQVLQQAIQVLQQLQQTLLMQQKQQQQRQLQQLLVTQLHQLQQQLQQQQPPAQQPQTNKHHQDVSNVSEALNKSIVEDGSQSPYSPPDESDGTPLQSPEHDVVTTGTTHPHSHLDKVRQSPASEHSLISSRRASPAPSHTSSQNMLSLATSQLTAARPNSDSLHLSSALAHYYDESLIGHVAGLIYDQTERQADMVAEEAHTVGSILCTQVSADLKGARSLVRAGEIISTLYEQRLLFIRQQIKDLDNWRTQNTFMPSLSASSNHRQGSDT